MSKKLKELSKLEPATQEGKLMEYARELGIASLPISNINGKRISDLTNMIINAERAEREHKLWIIALISAIASALSALAAWVAVTNL